MRYLKPVGGKRILYCNFHIRKLPIKLSFFYEECLKSFAGCSAATMQSVQEIKDGNLILQTIIWNNKFICIDGKTVFFKSLAEKGIFRIGNLISDKNGFITRCGLRDLHLTPLDVFRLVSVINALPNEWRCKLKESNYTVIKNFHIQEQIVLSIYKELRNRIITPPLLK